MPETPPLFPEIQISPPDTPHPAPLSSDRRRALLAMSIASVLFAVMGAATKAASRPMPDAPSLPGGELAFFRYLSGLVFLFALAAFRPISLLGEDRRGLLMRGISGGIASTSFFVGIKYTTLTNATLLNYTFVIWASLMAVFVLGEKLGIRAVFALLLAMTGVLLITRPEFGTINAGDLIALFSGVMAGLAVVQIRKLRRGEGSYAIFFYFNLCGLPISLLSLPLDRQAFVLPAFAQIPLLLVIGASSVAAQLLMTYGYREMTAAQGSLLTLTSVLYAALAGYFLFAEPLTYWTLSGGIFILLAASLLTLRARS